MSKTCSLDGASELGVVKVAVAVDVVAAEGGVAINQITYQLQDLQV